MHLGLLLSQVTASTVPNFCWFAQRDTLESKSCEAYHIQFLLRTARRALCSCQCSWGLFKSPLVPANPCTRPQPQACRELPWVQPKQATPLWHKKQRKEQNPPSRSRHLASVSLFVRATSSTAVSFSHHLLPTQFMFLASRQLAVLAGCFPDTVLISATPPAPLLTCCHPAGFHHFSSPHFFCQARNITG